RDPRGAVKLLDGVIDVYPENTAARLLRARAFFAAAQLRSAELEFSLVLEREPDNAFAHFALARTYERQGRPHPAKRHFRLAAALDPNPEHLGAARVDAYRAARGTTAGPPGRGVAGPTRPGGGAVSRGCAVGR